MNDEVVSDVLPYLPVLVALGEVEHVTAAAAMLGMQQPTVSRIIRRVEARRSEKPSPDELVEMRIHGRED